MSQPTQTPIKTTPFNIHRDLPSMAEIWTATFPKYPLPAENLRKLLPQENAHHFVASIESKTVGFCLAYTAKQPQITPTASSTPTSGYIAVLAVHPGSQRRGVGSALLKETKAWFKANFDPCRVEVGSAFPRFWPGVPVADDGGEDPSAVLDFFVNRGFCVRPVLPRSVDLYRDIRAFSLAEGEYVERAEGAGYTFAPLHPEGYAECLDGQERNFSDNADWVDMYRQLNPRSHPSSIMTAFDYQGAQVGWTLMLSPCSDVLHSNWAMPAVCGPKTGLVGCVGTDKEHRKSGVGVALVAHALEDMKKRGVEGVFVDWVSLEGFYEKIGFRVWCRYRTGEII
ncbi:hypothetical protein BDW62DRAFT_186487 [Aspergillus aurantiobrunneus]